MYSMLSRGSGAPAGLWLFLLCAAPAAGQAPAEGAPESAPLHEEPEVHSQVASFAVTKLQESPAVVTSLTADEIRGSGARDLMDVLMLVPGFFLGVDVQGTVGPSFRGLWGQEGKVLLLVDGKELNEQLYSTVQLGNELPIELIERVEVVRGPGSVIYGGNAEFAVINVITRGVQGGTDLLVAGTYGQYETSTGRWGLTLSGRKLFEGLPGLSIFASAFLGQGQRSDAEFEDFFGNSADMGGNSDLNPTTVQAGVGYRDLQLSMLYQRYDTTAVAAFDEALEEPAAVDFESFHAELSDRFRPSEQLEILPRLNFTLQEPYRDSDQESPFYYDKQVSRLRGRVVTRWAALDFLQLTGGADLALDRGQLKGPADVGLQTAFGDGEEQVSYTNIAGFIEAYSENPYVTVVAGARYDKHSAFGDSFVPRLVLLRSFGPFSGKALYSRAFRAPGVENISLGEDVSPERTTVLELEGTYRLGEGHAVSLNAFDVGVQDPIVYSYDAETASEAYRNLGRLGSRGIELAYQVRGSWGRAQLGYSFYTPSGRNDVEDYLVPDQEDAFTGLPTHKATATGLWRVLPWLSVSPTAVLVGKRYAVDAPDEMTGVSQVETLPAQLLLNLFVRAENVGTPGLEIGAGIYNVLGTDFRLAQPYNGGHAPMPAFAREFLVRVSYLYDAAASE